MTSLYAAEARGRKAMALVQIAEAAGYSAEQVVSNADVRRVLVEIAGVRRPSTETWALVAGMLSQLAEGSIGASVPA